MHVANGKVQHPLRGPNILIWVVGAWRKGFFYKKIVDVFLPFFQVVPQVLNVSPRMFLITLDLKPIYFAQIPPLFTYIPGVFIAMGISSGEK